MRRFDLVYAAGFMALLIILLCTATVALTQDLKIDTRIAEAQAKLDSLKAAAAWDSSRAVEQTKTLATISDSLTAIKKSVAILDTLGVKVMKADGTCTFYCSLGGGKMGWWPARDGSSVYLDLPESKATGMKLYAIKAFLKDAKALGGHYPVRDSTGTSEIPGRVYIAGNKVPALLRSLK